MARHDASNEISLMSRGPQDPDESSFPLQEEETNLIEVEDVSPCRLEPPALVSTNQRQSSVAQQPPPVAQQPPPETQQRPRSSPDVAGWKPQVVAPNKTLPLVEKVLTWGSENGWHDLIRRLVDAGKTNFSQYALYEKEMTPVPGQKDCFHYKGRVLRLIGMNRQNPRRLIDDYTKEVIFCIRLRTLGAESKPGDLAFLFLVKIA